MADISIYGDKLHVMSLNQATPMTIKNHDLVGFYPMVVFHKMI